MIKILLIDQQRLFCEAVKAIIEEEKDMEIVGIAITEQEIIKYLNVEEPDVILIDIHLLEEEGFYLMTQFKQTFPNIKIIYLTSNVRKELIIGAMVSGADGFLDKALNSQRLIWAVRDALNDQVVISGDAEQILVEEVIELSYDRRELLQDKLLGFNIDLTDRETDVALLMMDKLANKQIAEALYISEGTTKNYVSNIYDKINLRNRQQVIIFLQSLFSSDHHKQSNVLV